MSTLSAYFGDEAALQRIFQDAIPVVFRGDPRKAVPERLAPAARNIYFVTVLGGEVINGGISQFFSNSSGDFVPETLEALRAIGSELVRSLVEEALVAFGGALPPRDRVKRCELLFAFEEREPNALERIDRVFYADVYAREPKEDLEALLLEYARAHASEPLEALSPA